MKESKGTLSKESKYLIAIGGPTGVGKTKTAIHLAKHLGCPILSADSRQLYREMNIGTAKPSTDELAEVKHYFINHISIHDAYSVGKYEQEAISLLEQLYLDHHTIVMCGGTGLYHKVIAEGLDEFPDIPIQITDTLNEVYKREGITVLQHKLEQLDPVYHKDVDLDNSRRLIRALAVIEHTGKPYSSFIRKAPVKRPFEIIPIAIQMERPLLYQKIETRVDRMIQEGLVKEVQGLQKHSHLKSLQTVGYQEVIKHLNGEITLEAAIDLIKRNSRRYAKRQMTWYRNQGQWHRIDGDNMNEIMAYVVNKINT